MVHSMSDKSCTHGVIRGIVECPFYIKEDAQRYLLLIQSLLNLYHKLMKSCFHRLSSLLCMLVGLKWLEYQDFIPKESVYQSLQGLE